MSRLSTALIVALVLIAAPAAWAGRVQVSVGVGEEGDSVSYGFTASAGEANRVTVTALAPSGDNRTIVFVDSGAPITAGDGCSAIAGGAVQCVGPFGDFANSVDLITRDRDDRIDATALTLPGFTVFVDAGRGADVLLGSRRLVNALFGEFVGGNGEADTLVGGRRADFLEPGPGADDVDGRGGSDEVTYRDEEASVRVDLAAGTGRTTSGVDTLRSVERAEGGDGADTLLGDGGRNVFAGQAGGDVIDGRAGPDLLMGAEGPRFSAPPDRDLLRGGRGRDTLLGDAGPDSLFGGPGGDRLVGGRGLDAVAAGPGDDRVRSRDRRAETVFCGGGRDRLFADSADVPRGCERVRLAL